MNMRRDQRHPWHRVASAAVLAVLVFASGPVAAQDADAEPVEEGASASIVAAFASCGTRFITQRARAEPEKGFGPADSALRSACRRELQAYAAALLPPDASPASVNGAARSILAQHRRRYRTLFDFVAAAEVKRRQAGVAAAAAGNPEPEGPVEDDSPAETAVTVPAPAPAPAPPPAVRAVSTRFIPLPPPRPRDLVPPAATPAAAGVAPEASTIELASTSHGSTATEGTGPLHTAVTRPASGASAAAHSPAPADPAMPPASTTVPPENRASARAAPSPAEPVGDRRAGASPQAGSAASEAGSPAIAAPTVALAVPPAPMTPAPVTPALQAPVLQTPVPVPPASLATPPVVAAPVVSAPETPAPQTPAPAPAIAAPAPMPPAQGWNRAPVSIGGTGVIDIEPPPFPTAPPTFVPAPAPSLAAGDAASRPQSADQAATSARPAIAPTTMAMLAPAVPVPGPGGAKVPVVPGTGEASEGVSRVARRAPSSDQLRLLDTAIGQHRVCLARAVLTTAGGTAASETVDSVLKACSDQQEARIARELDADGRMTPDTVQRVRQDVANVARSEAAELIGLLRGSSR